MTMTDQQVAPPPTEAPSLHPTIITREALRVLDGAKVAYTIEATDPERTTVTFGHEALDRLALLVDIGREHESRRAW